MLVVGLGPKGMYIVEDAKASRRKVWLLVAKSISVITPGMRAVELWNRISL
jgi:hypothetical protein